MKYHLISLGCPKNRVDTEVLATKLLSEGLEIINQPEKAEVVVVNTCSFIEPAVQESEAVIKKLLQMKNKYGFKIVIAGCLIDRFPHKNWHSDEGIDLAVGSYFLPEISNLLINGQGKTIVGPLGLLASSENRKIISTYPYAFLKISEGCNIRCSFCTIPNLKGPFRSRPEEDIVEEAKNLLEKGIKELVLVSQDTGFYGMDLTLKFRLPFLLEKLNQLTGKFWIRVMYLNPMRINQELIKTLASLDKVVKYMDIPLQHTSDEVLRLMKRPYNYEYIVNLIESIRNILPEVILRSTFIIGFPGENQKDFNHLLDSLRYLQIPKVGFFPYYPEKHTVAYSLPGRLPANIVDERLAKVHNLQKEIMKNYNRSLIGSYKEVLIEKVKNKVVGRTSADAPEIDSMVYLLSEGKVNTGDFVRVKITGYRNVDLKGQIE